MRGRQIVPPQRARLKLALQPGAKLACRVANGSIVLTPQTATRGRPRLVRDRKTGLIVTRAPAGVPFVTSEQVRAALAEFP